MYYFSLLQVLLLLNFAIILVRQLRVFSRNVIFNSVRIKFCDPGAGFLNFKKSELF